MTNLNTAIQDEISLDDLFAEIDATPAEPAVEAVAQPTTEEPVEPASEPTSDDLEDADLDLSLLLDEQAAKQETGEIDEDDILNELFNEADLDEASLALDELAASEPTTKEPVVKEKPAEEKKPKRATSPSTYRTTYQNSKRSAVLLDRLGGDTSEIVLEFDDVELPEEELKAKQEKFLGLLNAQPTLTTNGETVQKKVAEKVVILFTMFKNNGKWNEVMYRTFKLLLTDGYISSGKDSNLVKDLLAKPYSIGTARAQAGQMMQMLPLLKIAKEEGGRLVPNENSTILARLRSQYFPEIATTKDAA